MPKLLASFKLIKPGVNCPGVNCPGVNRPGVNCPGVNRPGVYCPGVNCPPPTENLGFIERIALLWLPGCELNKLKGTVPIGALKMIYYIIELFGLI